MAKNPLTSRERRGVLIMLGIVLLIAIVAISKGYVGRSSSASGGVAVEATNSDTIEVISEDGDNSATKAKGRKKSSRKKKGKRGKKGKSRSKDTQPIPPRDFLTDTVR